MQHSFRRMGAITRTHVLRTSSALLSCTQPLAIDRACTHPSAAQHAQPCPEHSLFQILQNRLVVTQHYSDLLSFSSCEQVMARTRYLRIAEVLLAALRGQPLLTEWRAKGKLSICGNGQRALVASKQSRRRARRRPR